MTIRVQSSELDIHLCLWNTQTQIVTVSGHTKFILVRSFRVLNLITIKLNGTSQHKKTNRLLVEVKLEICKGEMLRYWHVDGIWGRVDRFNWIKVELRPRLEHLPASSEFCLLRICMRCVNEKNTTHDHCQWVCNGSIVRHIHVQLERNNVRGFHIRFWSIRYFTIAFFAPEFPCTIAVKTLCYWTIKLFSESDLKSK